MSDQFKMIRGTGNDHELLPDYTDCQTNNIESNPKRHTISHGIICVIAYCIKTYAYVWQFFSEIFYSKIKDLL